jgi:hypothetical protein
LIHLFKRKWEENPRKTAEVIAQFNQADQIELANDLRDVMDRRLGTANLAELTAFQVAILSVSSALRWVPGRH